MIHHNAEFCSFSVPDNWLPRPPSGFLESASDEAIMVEVEEQWVEEGASIPAYLEERKPFLERCFEDFAVVEEGPLEAGSPGAHGLTVRYEDDDLQPTLQREVYLAEGPLLCILRMTAAAAGDRRLDQTFDGLAKTFTLTGGQTLAKAETFPLFADPGRPAPEDPQAQRTDFPFCCVSLPVPYGWSAEADGVEAVFHGSQAEVRLRRLLGAVREPGTWMGKQLEGLRENQAAHLLGYSRGELEEQGAFTALLIDETAGTRTWRTASTRKTLKLMIGEPEPLEWTWRGALKTPAEAEPVLGQLIAGTVLLDSEQWRTKPGEPWIDAVLEGPWTSTVPGLYMHPDGGFPLLELRSQKTTMPVDQLRPHLLEAMRTGAGVLPGTKTEKEGLGTYKGLEGYRYAGDGTLSIRAFWQETRELLYSVMLQMREAPPADEIFPSLVESLRLPGMRERR